jgi:hypothetical protein
VKRFEFTESGHEQPVEVQPGLEEFLNDPALRGDASDEEIGFLKSLRPPAKRPTPLYYYRELQNLRDPLHFHPAPGKPGTIQERASQANRTRQRAPVQRKRKTVVRASARGTRNKKQRA